MRGWGDVKVTLFFLSCNMKATSKAALRGRGGGVLSRHSLVTVTDLVLSVNHNSVLYCDGALQNLPNSLLLLYTENCDIYSTLFSIIIHMYF